MTREEAIILMIEGKKVKHTNTNPNCYYIWNKDAEWFTETVRHVNNNTKTSGIPQYPLRYKDGYSIYEEEISE